MSAFREEEHEVGRRVMIREIIPNIRRAPEGRLAQVEILAEMFEDGANFKMVREKSKELGWDYADCTLRRIAKLAERMAVRRIRNRQAHRIWAHIARREALYRKAVSKGDEATALRILQDLAKLERLYPADRTEIEHKHTGKVQVEASLFADVLRYEDEFRLAAKAERIERQITQVGAADELAAGMILTTKEINAVRGGQPAPEENHGDEPILEDIENPDQEW